MSENQAQHKHKYLDTDPNVLQNQASNPESSVWVGASAGSGKTKVLTDRILRLLLPNKDGINACLPHKILALTFTKAAASEMALRINKRLSEWAVMPLNSEGDKEGLYDDLKQLLGHEPSEIQIESARKIFAVVVDTPGGLKIMTIHSFCQSILGRFPLEADLSPSFSALEEDQANKFLQQSQQHVFEKAQNEKGSPLHQAVHHLALHQNEDQFNIVLKSMMSERRQMHDILKKNFGTDGLYNALCQQFSIPAGLSEDEFLYDVCDENNFSSHHLWDASKALSAGSKTDIERGQNIQQWLEYDIKERIENFESYYQIFMTTKNEIRKKFATKTIDENNPDLTQNLQEEAARLLEAKEKIDGIKTSTLTRDLFIIGEAILAEFTTIKEKFNTLDFDDLILKTLYLLHGQTKAMENLDVTPWVRYKLDQGIDHLLVDEAQDTNPEQWEIIKALSDDFFSHQENDTNRSLFVVGDQKQSIFSFQRASPEKFIDMRHWFKEKITANNKPFADVKFNVSFRSTKSILTLVDHIFARPDLKEGLESPDNEIKHQSFRHTQAGHIELWPIFESPKKEDFDPWEPPIKVIESSSGASQMAAHIGQTIQKWIDEKEILASYNRPIEAGDIMILVRSRNAFIDQLVRALKIRNIPVSGVDRMILSQQLVVQDLCAAAQFALLPEDDLNLACLLKSPFLGLDEQALFDLCHGRDAQSLWQSVKENASDGIVKWLESLIHIGGKVRPYEFFEHILQHECPADRTGLVAIKARLGDESLDPLNEFLNKALQFEDDNIPTLQQFIQAQLQNESQIKRQLEEGNNAVRIMTIHAAKGLQAPIVILPDTTRTPSSVKAEKILWPDRSDEGLPYFCPQSKNIPPNAAKAMGVLKKRQNEEYRRLLYVALTRAEERLYIGGYKGRTKVMDECWYNYVQYGFDSLNDVQTIEENGLEIRSYKNPATAKADRMDKDKPKTSSKTKQNNAPSWLFEKVEQEQASAKPLTPSRSAETDLPALSPLRANDDYRFLRGNITHKLLQILPDLPIEHRQKAVQKYVQQPAHAISTKIQQSIMDEVFKILENPNFADIFGPQSMAEVPITGLVDNTPISGQIDRLLVTDDEIFIIDYKSNRPPPKDVTNVPAMYFNQMKAYADIMRDIYPNRTIRSALIWTDGAKLMELENL